MFTQSPGDKPYSCKQCAFGFATPEELQDHVKVHEAGAKFVSPPKVPASPPRVQAPELPPLVHAPPDQVQIVIEEEIDGQQMMVEIDGDVSTQMMLVEGDGATPGEPGEDLAQGYTVVDASTLLPSPGKFRAILVLYNGA